MSGMESVNMQDKKKQQISNKDLIITITGTLIAVGLFWISFPMFNELQNTMGDEQKVYDNDSHDDEITMEDIDPILEKIKEQGIDSLTEQEKIILKKYTNK